MLLEGRKHFFFFTWSALSWGKEQWQHQEQLLGLSARHLPGFQISEMEGCEMSLGNKVINDVFGWKSLG